MVIQYFAPPFSLLISFTCHRPLFSQNHFWHVRHAASLQCQTKFKLSVRFSGPKIPHSLQHGIQNRHSKARFQITLSWTLRSAFLASLFTLHDPKFDPVFTSRPSLNPPPPFEADISQHENLRISKQSTTLAARFDMLITQVVKVILERKICHRKVHSRGNALPRPTGAQVPRLPEAVMAGWRQSNKSDPSSQINCR